jgi:hypothetical protein
MSDDAAYLRRSLALLSWIDSSQPEARVAMGPIELGFWREIAPRWQLRGARICLQLRARGRSLVFWISSVHPAPWGATLKVWHRNLPHEEIHVVWRNQLEQARLSRCIMLKAVRGWVRSHLPGCRILSESRVPDRTHTLSGAFLRLRLRGQESDHLVLACGDAGAADQVHEILTQGLLWLACLQGKGLLRAAPAIHLLVPAGHGAVICHRAGLVNQERARIEVWEYAESASGQWETWKPPAPVPPQEERDFRWPVLGPFRWSPMLARVMALAPEAIQRYPRFQDYDSLRLWGLEFASVHGTERDRVLYGVGPQQAELTEDNFDDLRALVEMILYYRRPDSPAPDHPYYRMQSERWLECLLLTDIARLFPELVPGSVYPQIPVYLGKVPGRVDILGADRDGNLVVMELKVSQDANMPLQSLDYWGRVVGHNLSGDFEKRGYFAGLRLSRARPKIYLVSPLFSFHDSLERVLRYLDPNLEVSKIGINEDWRCGAKILRRFSCRCGELR